jgi:hypothetical protein
MIRAALLAEYLGNLQPLHVRSRLLGNETFGAHFGLVLRTVMTIGGDIHVDQPKLFAAVRQALADQQPGSLMDTDGHEMVVMVKQGRLFLKSPSTGREFQLNEFRVLSPHQEERIRTLKHLIDLLGPTAPDFSALLTTAVERELHDDEVGELFAERAHGVAALQARATAAFDTSQVTLENLVPDSFAYFERFCGPNPGDAEHEEYFRTILPQYRKDLIHRDLVRGLDMCLQGALRDDLMPGAWTENVSDDELWDALTACDPWRAPFALLGALDIALGRQHDERYRTFAEEAVTKLLQEEFPRPDGIDTYELLPLWAALVLNRINGLEDGALRPPCWKRMCAWMHAGYLSRLTQDFSLELDHFREWVWGNQMRAGMYAALVDLRHEPMYRAAEMSRSALREEVIGRLVLVRERHQTAERSVPGSSRIDETVAGLMNQGLLGWAMPGPLDGHYRPAETGTSRLSEHDIGRFQGDLANDSDASILTTLAYLSQRFDLGAELLTQMRDMITRSAFASEETGLDERLGRLVDASLIACAQRDGELANAIASTVVAAAQWAHSSSDVRRILRALLIASAAFQNEDAWAEWLEGQLTEVAFRLSAGELSKEFLVHLRELKKVLKLSLGIHVRAEALASAAN